MDITIDISPRRWAAALAAAVVGVASASVGASLLSFVPLQDPVLMHLRDTFVRLAWVDGEANIPAWFSASLLLCAALLLGGIASAHRRLGERAFPWWLLSLVFVLLSLDEIAQLHELSIRPLREQFHASGFLYYPWIVPAGICASTLVIGYSGFLTALPGRTRWLFLTAGAIYVLGALGVEALSGRQASLHGEQSGLYHVIVTFEELLEMTGVAVFIYALLDYIGRRFSRLVFHFRGS
jgi:hypothetical protein